MKRLTIMSIVLFVILLVACTPMMPARNQTINKTTEPATPTETEVSEPTEPTETEIPPETEVKEPEQPPEEPPVDLKDVPVKEVMEGELVSFPNLKAVDPDGDPITYSFTAPLNQKGEWQTKEGDAGDKLVTITASDGTNTVSQKLLIRVNPKNKPPVIEIEEPVNAVEGETLTLLPTVTDPDGDKINITFSGWINTNTKKLGYEDGGLHKVTITASDGKATVTKEIVVAIENANRAPTLSTILPITIKEGEKAVIKANGKDQDNDVLTYTYDYPFDDAGVWQTEVGDAGEYDVIVKATDGELTAETTVKITVTAINKAPAIKQESPITVTEGDTVTLNPEITDEEGDEFRVTYSGWMTTSVKVTDYEDQGEHKVTITARDTAGNEARFEVTVIVNDVNRAPIFGAGSFN